MARTSNYPRAAAARYVPGRRRLGLYLCLSCNHPLVFHKVHGGSEPCFFCPPDNCLVELCKCKKYEGMKLTVLPHSRHKSTATKWGSWGFLYFAMKDEQTLINGAEPVVERVVINR